MRELNYYRMRTILCTGLLLALVRTSWTAPPPQAKPKQPATSRLSTTPRSDAAIETDIRARYKKSKIRTEGFTVRVQGGLAIIEGKTKVIQRKGVATRLAKLGGARGVENRIQVDEAARERAAANLEKGRRRAQVKRGGLRTETAVRAAPAAAPGTKQ